MLAEDLSRARAFEWPTMRRSDRAGFLGPTGSGKSELLKAVLVAQTDAIVIDTKQTEDWTAIGEIVGERDVYRCRGGRFIYRVEPDFLIDETRSERFFRWALHAGRRVIAIDELLDIPPSPGLKILSTQGRSAGVGLWVATQRPHGIPLYALTETQHTFTFGLRLKRDRERVEEAVSGAAIPWDYLAKHDHSFVYIDKRGVVSKPAVLSL